MPIAALTMNGSPHALTVLGERVLNNLRSTFLSHKGGTLETMQRTYPQLRSIEEEDWSVTRQLLLYWLHNSLKSHWESRVAGKFDAKNPEPPPPISDSPIPPAPKAPAPHPSSSHASTGKGGLWCCCKCLL